MGGETASEASSRELGERETERETKRARERDYVRVRDYGDQCGKPCLFCAGPIYTDTHK